MHAWGSHPTPGHLLRGAGLCVLKPQATWRPALPLGPHHSAAFSAQDPLPSFPPSPRETGLCRAALHIPSWGTHSEGSGVCLFRVVFRWGALGSLSPTSSHFCWFAQPSWGPGQVKPEIPLCPRDGKSRRENCPPILGDAMQLANLGSSWGQTTSLVRSESCALQGEKRKKNKIRRER